MKNTIKSFTDGFVVYYFRERLILEYTPRNGDVKKYRFNRF